MPISPDAMPSLKPKELSIGTDACPLGFEPDLWTTWRSIGPDT